MDTLINKMPTYNLTHFHKIASSINQHWKEMKIMRSIIET
jgi:hypothetical protein